MPQSPKVASPTVAVFKPRPREIPSGGRYQPRDFICPVSDNHGHSTLVQFRVVPEIERVVSELVDAKKFPYASKADFYRHAVQRHAEFLQALEPTIETHMHWADAVQEQLRHYDEALRFQGAVEHTKTIVRDLCASGAEQDARECLHNLMVSLGPHVGDRWAMRFLEQLESEFGDLLAQPS